MMGSLTQHMRNPRDAAKLRGQQRRRQPPMSPRQKAMIKAEQARSRAAMASGDQFYGTPKGAVTARQQPARATQARQYPTMGVDPERQRIYQQLRARQRQAAGTNPAAAAPGGAPTPRRNVRAPGIPDQQPRAVPLPNPPMSRQINKGGYMKKTTKMNMGGYANCGASVKASGGKKA